MGQASERADLGGRALGAVLAGGRGDRIGGAKATVALAGRPLISFPLAAIEAAGLEPVVIAKRGSALPPLSCLVIEEPDRPRHPLCGIVAALEHARGRAVVAVGCDMPFLAPELLAWLAAAPEPLVVPAPRGRAQPFPGRYTGELLEALERELEGAPPMHRAIESLAPRLLGLEELAAFGDPERLCFNVNAPADLERAHHLLGDRPPLGP